MPRLLPLQISLAAVFAVAALSGCAQTQWRSGTGPVQTLATADQMMDLEQSDRVARFQRLAQLHGVSPPQIEQAVVPASAVPGATRAIPVIRVVFDERAFFAPGSAVPQPGADAILQVIADNMHHDVPDVRVTLLGHADATGSAATNDALARERALAVFQRLAALGVNPAQLDTVAIGAAQPIAPNDTAAGRARNRRVELLISPSEAANLRVVQTRPVDPAWLRTGSGAPSARPARSAEILKPSYAGPADFSEAPVQSSRRIVLTQAGQLPLESSNPVAVSHPDAAGSGSPLATP